MSILNYSGNLIVWSPIPYRQEIFNLAIKELMGESPYQIKYVIVANNEHNLHAHEYKEKFGSCKIIAGETVKLKNGCQIDHKLSAKFYDRVISGDDWVEKLEIDDSFFAQNLEMLCLKNHSGNDICLFDKLTKSLYVGDLVFNLGVPGTTSGHVQLEQYSEATGYPKGFNPHGGLSFITRYTQPRSRVSQWLAWILAGTRTEAGMASIRKINNWEFDRIVLIHGNVIEKDAKEEFKRLFYYCFY